MNVVVSAPSLRPRFDPRIALALATVYVIWGSTYFAMRIAVSSLPPWSMAGSRFLTAGLLSLVIARARNEELPGKREWLLAVPTGLLLFVIGNGLVAVAEQSLSSSVAAVVAATTPLFATAIRAARGERATRPEVVGMVLGLLGVVVLARGAEELFTARGVVLLVAPVGFAAGSLLVRSSGPQRGGLAVAAPAMIAGGGIMVALGAASGERLPVAFPWNAAGAWLYLVVVGSVIAFTTYAWLLRHTSPTVSMSHAYVNPLVAVVLGAAVGGERFGTTALFATMLIAAGVMIAVATKRRAR
jgi:drug/metabolite transporter (DMT)-like permease